MYCWEAKKLENESLTLINQPKVTAVVVTFNRKELLKENLVALSKIQYTNFNVLIIDNASTDNTYDFIYGILSDKRFAYLNTGKNLGGAGGFSFGIKEALRNNADYIWIMDDDCIPNQDSLEELLKFANHNPDFGFLSSKVLRTDGSLCKMNIQRTNLKKEINSNDSIKKIKLASFVSMFLNSKAVMDVGLPFKEFFIWGDDWEYSSRISKKFDCYYVLNSVVLHKCKINGGVNIIDEKERLDRYFYAYRNETFFYRQNGLNGMLYSFLKVNFHRLKLLLSNDQKKKEKLNIIKRGVKAAKTFNPKPEFVFSPKTKINVCTFFGEPVAYGGQEAFMINMINAFNDANMNYIVATPFNATNNFFLKSDKIHLLTYNFKFDSFLRKRNIVKAFKLLIKKEKIDVLHIQSGSTYVLLKISSLAKKHNIKKVIIHSHCAGEINLKYKIIKFLSDKKIDKLVDVYLACSDLAAIWKFPQKIIAEKKYTIIKNGIDTKKFTFSPQIRKEYRDKFLLGNQLTLCNVGRLSEQKNQKFIIDICKILLDKKINFKVFLVGEGELKEDIVSYIKNNSLTDKFILLEKRDDIEKIMMASDIFLLPSLYEGLAVTSIEAQCTGLLTLCSTNITDETKLTDIIEFLDITDAKLWANKIAEYSNKLNDLNRPKYANIIEESGYDSNKSADLLEKIYRGLN